MAKKIRNKGRDNIDFGKSKIDPLFAYSSIFFAMNVAIIGYYQSTEQNTRAMLCMLFRGLIFLVPAFILMPLFISPQGMWLAVPVTECMTLGVILLTNKDIISR